MRLSKLLIITLLSLSLIGCGKDDGVTTNKTDIYEYNESFIKLHPSNTNKVETNISSGETTEINIQTSPIFELELKQEEEIIIENDNEQYKDLIESNIIIDIGDIDTDIHLYDWFIVPDGTSYDYYEIYQYIIYGIERYYKGEVPDTFTSVIPDDIFDETTNMIFKVKVHGEQLDLVLHLDLYNNNIKVEEV